MKKIKSIKIISDTAHPAVGHKVTVTFDDNSTIDVYQDTLLCLYDTDKEEELIGKEWKGK